MKTVEFQTNLLRWYKTNKRPLLWRQTTDPYKILVSEVMLQQTQVDRVLPKYQAFLDAFPTAHDLAKAPPAKVLRLWSGLGYNRRAINLLTAARELSARIEQGAVPHTIEEWRTLPGIGPYTASAVLAFAENKPVTVIDTNVRRVLFRLFIGRSGKGWGKKVERLATKLVPEGRSRDWHNALMDFGATICMAKPKCGGCPFRKQCVSVSRYKRTPEQLEAMASRTFKTTQGTFKGSNRYYRGQILKVLQQEDGQTLRMIGKRLKQGFNGGDLPWLQKLVITLVKDGLITKKGSIISLPSKL